MRRNATTRVPIETRDRLRRFGRRGQTYREIIEGLMDSFEYEEFMKEQHRRLGEHSAFVPLREA